jgi:hypothetical protein
LGPRSTGRNGRGDVVVGVDGHKDQKLAAAVDGRAGSGPVCHSLEEVIALVLHSRYGKRGTSRTTPRRI